MDPSAEDIAGTDVDTEMTVLQPEDITQQNPDASDEVENLRNRYKAVIIICVHLITANVFQ